MKTKACKFDYLKNWIETGSTVVLECNYSRSGMSMSVWSRDRKIFTVQGCGFDRVGTAIGDFLEPLYQEELKATIKPDPARPYCSAGWFGGHLYGSVVRPDSSISLDGGCGQRSMEIIADAIGLQVSTESTRNSTLILIEKKG